MTILDFVFIGLLIILSLFWYLGIKTKKELDKFLDENLNATIYDFRK